MLAWHAPRPHRSRAKPCGKMGRSRRRNVLSIRLATIFLVAASRTGTCVQFLYVKNSSNHRRSIPLAPEVANLLQHKHALHMSPTS